MHKAGKVRNPIGLLSVLARKAGLGLFAPNYSIRQSAGARIGLAENGGGTIGLDDAVCAVTILESA